MLSAPLDTLLASHGDERQTLREDTGLTKYRTSFSPRVGVPFGSCTASWPSERAYAAGSALLQELRAQPDPALALDDAQRNFTARLRTLFDAPRATMVYAPSGTDVIYMVSALALASSGRSQVHHVVVGASELGGGTLRAAAGLTFSTRTPFGGEAEVGAPVEGLAGACSSEPLYLRGEGGGRVDVDEIDAETVQRVHEAAARGAAVVVHLVAHSKTGLRAPSLTRMARLKEELGDQLMVLVDAAQGRVAPIDLRRALALGFPVLWTGSKFYSGPPFSGLLVLPEALREDPGPLPTGLSSWFSAADLPRHWRSARAGLSAAANPGLTLRWALALAEMEAYHDIPTHQRGRVYHTFAGAVVECFGVSDTLQLDMPRPPAHLLAGGLGAFPTVFSFSVDGPSGRLDALALRRLYELLDTDLGEQDARLKTRFHIGQPVVLGPPDGEQRAVLRVALGARLVVDVADQPDAGGAWFRAHLGELRTQIELLVEGL